MFRFIWLLALVVRSDPRLYGCMCVAFDDFLGGSVGNHTEVAALLSPRGGYM
jgi:hypothetical protein